MKRILFHIPVKAKSLAVSVRFLRDLEIGLFSKILWD